MANVITGRVEQISEKAGQFGPMISYKVNGEWFLLKGAKFKQRDVSEGSFVDVEFDVNPRGYKDIVKGGLRIATADAPAPATAAKPTGRAAATPYADPRQDIISKQAALNTALQFVTLAANNGVLPFSASAKQADKLSLFRAWWLDEAAKSFELSTGKAWEMPEQEAPAKATRGKPAAKPDVVEPQTDSGTDEYPDDDIPY